MALGVKSLAVKPFRLAFTILLSAVAFAVFGLFDTLANFNTKSVLDNIMHASPTAISLYGEYKVDYDAEDKYDVKLSQEKLDDLSTQTGYKLKGVYDEKDNANGYVQTAYSINELLKTQVTWGKNYYSKYVNGFVEFGEDEVLNEDRREHQNKYLFHCASSVSASGLSAFFSGFFSLERRAFTAAIRQPRVINAPAGIIKS